MGEQNGKEPLVRRLRLDSPRRRIAQALVAATVALAGTALAVVDGMGAPAHVTRLAESGSFYALAASDSTLYAASDNGGSILLERSSNQGVDWAASPVPYSAVAVGVPWTHAAVAADGDRIVMAASSGGTLTAPLYRPGVPYPAALAFPVNGTCSTNSTVFVGTSSDGGLSWSSQTLESPDLAVTSLQVSLVGSSAAVAWVGTTYQCGSATTTTEAITSLDGGATWGAPQSLGVPNAAVPPGEALEMAPDSQGIVVAFGVLASNSSQSDLALWRLVRGGASFSALGVLPAPTSWTLQGSPSTPSYLLTPTYLIPLTNAPYTALPFDQLQSDAPSIGALPSVVSLVPERSGVVEIAATTANNLGVDCWQFDTVRLAINEACHVSLVTPLVSAGEVLPIVSLIDGGGWWVAIGASGTGCPPGCVPSGGGPIMNPPAAPTNGPAVGTSVCLAGCSSAQGLDAYSFDGTAARVQGGLAIGGVVLLVAGGAWLIVVAAARAKRGARAPRPRPQGADAQRSRLVNEADASDARE
ncbi:MAG TPA: sialidase family protein [Thermoplasmata archaeon]|nr:sialidase family protein [Thermoplasmata archaeon]